MTFINTDGMAIIGPGSEWFWIMAQFVALAVTGLAILRQLRAQRSAAVFDQMAAWSHEFDEPTMTRHKLALMLAIQDPDPSSGLPHANLEVPDYFERVGYLISRGHVSSEDFWSGSREIVAFYWGVLAPTSNGNARFELIPRSTNGSSGWSSRCAGSTNDGSVGRGASILQHAHRRSPIGSRSFESGWTASA